jgi:nucleoside phosphorylase
MIGILFATRREAEPFIDLAAARFHGNGPFDTFCADDAWTVPVVIAVSGMGKVAAAAATSHLVLARRAGVLINAGICGRLTDDGAAVGDCFRIAAAVEGDCERFGEPEPAVACDGGWFRGLPVRRLVTCDRPVFDARRRAELSVRGDLIDMEGAAVSRVAGLYGIPCAMLKGVSDSADTTGRQAIASNIGRVSARIARTLMDELTATYRMNSDEI